jgi:hypothetical protein
VVDEAEEGERTGAGDVEELGSSQVAEVVGVGGVRRRGRGNGGDGIIARVGCAPAIGARCVSVLLMSKLRPISLLVRTRRC